MTSSKKRLSLFRKAAQGLVALMLFSTLIPAPVLHAQSSIEQIEKVYRKTTPEERATHQTDLMGEKLSLDSDTRDKVYAINLVHTEKMAEIFLSEGGKFSKGRKAKALSKEKDRALKEVLSGEQYNTWLQLKKERRDNRKNNK